MKKFLLALSLVTLFAGCKQAAPIMDNSTPGDPAVEKVFAPQMFYVADLGVDEAGDYLLTQNFVTWLSEADGTCSLNDVEVDEGSSLPQCNPNGFLILESDSKGKITIPAETYVYVSNLAALLDMGSDMGEYVITMDELMAAFELHPDFFEVTPFEVVYGTVVINGREMTDQVSGINEIYIP